jgi:hypothetical protein
VGMAIAVNIEANFGHAVIGVDMVFKDFGIVDDSSPMRGLSPRRPYLEARAFLNNIYVALSLLRAVTNWVLPPQGPDGAAQHRRCHVKYKAPPPSLGAC